MKLGKLQIIVIVAVIVGVFSFLLSRNQTTKPKSPDYATINEPTKTPQKDPQVAEFEELLKARQIASSHNRMAYDLFKKLVESDTSQNILVSPPQLGFLLSPLYNFSEAKTREETAVFLKAQGFSYNDFNDKSRILNKKLDINNYDSEFFLNNSIWINSDYKINKDVIETVKSNYGVNLDELNNQNADSLNFPQKFLLDNTSKKVLLTSYKHNNSYIISAIGGSFFKGKWNLRFDQSSTKNSEFSSFDGQKAVVPTMKISASSFNYYEDDLYQSTKLEMGNKDRISAYLVLPKANNLLFLKNLSFDSLNEKFNSHGEMTGSIEMPKTTIEYEKDLTETVSDMGLKNSTTQNSNFLNLGSFKTNINQGPYLSKVYTKNIVEFTEEGNQDPILTPAPSLGYNQTPPPTFNLKLNRPFIFFIQDNYTSEILYIGLVRKL